ncbi:MAG: hypothetical protein R6U63_05415 [Longimicrobiales bacterium]
MDDRPNGPDTSPDPELGGLLSRLARSMGPGGVELGGENVRFEQAPEDGLEARITLLDRDGAVTSVASMLLPSAQRPAAHPEGVPFVRHASLRVIDDHVRAILLAMWILEGDDAPDPKTALAAVLRECRETGWRLEEPTDRAGPITERGGPRSAPGRPGPGGAPDTADAGPFRLLRGDQVRRVEAKTGHMGPVISLSQKRQVRDAGPSGLP